jgi:hypothetical protein
VRVRIAAALAPSIHAVQVSPTVRADGIATGYGFKVCGQD